MFALVLPLLSLLSLGYATTETSVTITENCVYDNLVGSQNLLTDFEFSSSWNKPSNVSFSPQYASDSFNRVVLELQVNTTGANYDRLVMLFIDDIEIWRSSTPEPDTDGTRWIAKKDLSHYGTLFESSHTVNLVIQNVVEGSLDGVFYATLIAHYYDDASAPARSDDSWAIDLNDLPTSVTALRSSNDDAVSVWYAPSDESSVTIDALDRSVNRALLHVFASENGDDEFWWQGLGTEPGPSRFINVYVNNSLAGVITPFPNIFTGGVDPYLWRPIVGLRAFDLPAYFIDITPFLPVLWEGSTTIELVALNGIDGTEIPWSWILSMNLLTWSTDGQSNSGSVGTPSFQNTTTNGSSVLANYELVNTANLTIGGQEQTVEWKQVVNYNNTNSDNLLYQLSEGSTQISGLYSFEWDFSFPLTVTSETDYVRVQQTYQGIANSQDYSSWMDSSVTSTSSGSFGSSSSAQYLSGPQGAHYASSSDLTLDTEW